MRKENTILKDSQSFSESRKVFPVTNEDLKQKITKLRPSKTVIEPTEKFKHIKAKLDEEDKKRSQKKFTLTNEQLRRSKNSLKKAPEPCSAYRRSLLKGKEEALEPNRKRQEQEKEPIKGSVVQDMKKNPSPKTEESSSESDSVTRKN